MANMLENYGLDFLSEDSDTLMGFVGYITKNGKAKFGYHGTPYLFASLGDVEFWVTTEENSEGNLQVTSFNSHCCGTCVWKMSHSGIDITPKDYSPLEKIIIFNKCDTNEGLLPINIINADVLPSFLKDDIITMQIVALPLDIQYYADEDAYAEAQPADKNGEKWLMATGSMVALSFLYNHAPDRYEEGKDYFTDSYVHFTATVKELYHGTFNMDGEQHNTFIRCIASTRFGDLEFNHAYDQVPEELRDNIKVGAIISGTCILSGDVAIYEHTDGLVKDFEHNLQLLRHIITKGEAERLKSVLADDSVFETDATKMTYYGPQEIINRFNYVHSCRGGEYTAHPATIVSIDEEGLEYSIGTQCLVLAAGEEDNYESILFLSNDENDMIKNIKITRDGRYHFKID